MPISAKKITSCLWFDTQAEEAANFYCSIFKNSKIGASAATERKGLRSTARRRER